MDRLRFLFWRRSSCLQRQRGPKFSGVNVVVDDVIVLVAVVVVVRVVVVVVVVADDVVVVDAVDVVC